MPSKKAKSIPERIYCNECQGKTVHRIVGTAYDGGTNDDTGYWWSTAFEMLQCGGCQEVVLRRTFSFSEDSENGRSLFSSADVPLLAPMEIRPAARNAVAARRDLQVSRRHEPAPAHDGRENLGRHADFCQ